MDIKSTLAARGYINTGGINAGGLTAAQTRSGTEAEEAVGRFAAEFVGAMKEGEQTVANGLTGKADPHSVVEALAATELAVQTAVSVRDKVIEAYQEILRMPV